MEEGQVKLIQQFHILLSMSKCVRMGEIDTSRAGGFDDEMRLSTFETLEPTFETHIDSETQIFEL
jgi:hypothetical protein